MKVRGDQIGLNLLGCKTLKGGNIKMVGQDHFGHNDQGFPKVLRIWGGCTPDWGGGRWELFKNLMGGGLSQYMGGGVLNRVLENIYEGVHLLVKLPAINRQACKFTKNELLHIWFSRILARF